MARREIEGDGAGPQGVGTRPQGVPGAASASPAHAPTAGAAARYLDVWDANQSEVSRLGPQVLPGAGAFFR